MIDGYPNFECCPGNPITDSYKNEDDDRSEYEYSERVQEEISLEDEVYIYEPPEEEYSKQEMGEEKYYEEDLNIISEEPDEKVEEEYNITIEDDIEEEDLIVDKPSSNEYYEEIPSATEEGLIEKSTSLRNNTRLQRPSESRNIQEHQPSLEGKAYDMQFLLISKQKNLIGLMTVTGRP